MKRKEVLLDLTSLLDVILIIVFMVMNQNSKMVEAANAELDNMSGSYDEMKSENESLHEEYDKLSDELKEALAKLGEGDAETLLERLQNAENRLEGYEYMDEIVTVVNISFDRYGNTTELTYGKADEPTDTRNSLKIKTDEDFASSLNKLQMYLDDQVRETVSNLDATSFVYIVFSYDENTIKQTQYYKIVAVLNKEEQIADGGRITWRINKLQNSSEE